MKNRLMVIVVAAVLASAVGHSRADEGGANGDSGVNKDPNAASRDPDSAKSMQSDDSRSMSGAADAHRSGVNKDPNAASRGPGLSVCRRIGPRFCRSIPPRLRIGVSVFYLPRFSPFCPVRPGLSRARYDSPSMTRS